MKSYARKLGCGPFLIVTALLTISQAVYAYMDVIPVVSSQFSLGQWYFDGTQSALGGNAGLSLVPALRFSHRFSVIPTFESSYRGTRSYEELAGGNNLFQDTWENAFSVKAVHGLNSRWNVRERVGFRAKWFRETTNESWNKGLYDYRTLSFGGELERHWEKKVSIAGGYDYSFLRFPNYVSLESTQSNDLAREYAGDNVLDQRIHLLSLRTKTPLGWKTGSEVQIFYSPRTYTSQKVVEITGLLTPEPRKDIFFGTTLSFDRIFKTIKNSNLISTVRLGYTALDSNQNHYDARLTKFVADFYDYDQLSLGSQFTLAFGQQQAGPMTIDLGYTYSSREYRSRVIQSADGAYLSSKLNVRDTAIYLGYTYPLSKNFRLKATSTFGRSKSNNAYEAVYRYNYSNANYQFGFTYDY